jgi:hypothetical protein
MCFLVSIIPEDGQSQKNPVFLNIIHHRQNPLESAVFIVHNLRSPGKISNYVIFTEIRLHKICRAPYIYTIKILLQK